MSEFVRIRNVLLHCSNFNKLKTKYLAAQRNKRVDKLVKVLFKMEEDTFYKAQATHYGMRTSTNSADILRRHTKGMAISIMDMVSSLHGACGDSLPVKAMTSAGIFTVHIGR